MKFFSGIVLLLLLSCGSRNVETVVIRGSDTEVNLVLQLAENFMDADPNVSIAVTGGGSGTGIAALINKKTDIANSSRAFKASEIKLAEERNVEVLPIIFAVDALCFIVHSNLDIDSLSIQQIRDIYTGKTENWSELGGKNLEVSLYGRQGNSGTFSFIQEHILKANYSQKMKQMNGTSQIIEGIKNDPAGIGYAGIGYIVDKNNKLMDGVKVLSVKKTASKPAISPLKSENITNGNYPIVRPLYQYIDGKPAGKLKEFIQYELSAEGQKIISENGYFPITNQQKRHNEKILK